MSTLSPKQAASLAYIAYDARKGGNYENTPIEIKNDFTLNDLAKGTSGGYFFRQETGFALLGKGKSQRYRNDLVIACRGTASLADGITDLTCNRKGTDTGEMVHSGFQTTFYSMRSGLKKFLLENPTTEFGTVHCVGHSLGGGFGYFGGKLDCSGPIF